MRIRTAVFLLCMILILSACGRVSSAEETVSVSESAQTDSSELPKALDDTAPSTVEAAQTQSVSAEPTGTQSDPTEPFSALRLPGHIASDVYVRLWDGDTAPGLRAEDAETVKQIFSAQTWGYSYDNISDVWIEAQGVSYAYETQAGILTAADDRAVKLRENERVRLNAILARYLPEYGTENGFSEQ